MADDYALTRVGREPARAKVMARLAKEPIFAANNEAALNMFTSRYVPLKVTLKVTHQYQMVLQTRDYAGLSSNAP